MEAELQIQPDSVDLRVLLIREYFRLSKQYPSAEKRPSLTSLADRFAILIFYF